MNTRINGKRAVVTMIEDEVPIVATEQVVEDNGYILSEIERLKSELQESDYKITKIAEAMSIGAELPYDAKALHKERQALRDRINQLEMEVQSGEDEQ